MQHVRQTGRHQQHPIYTQILVGCIMTCAAVTSVLIHACILGRRLQCASLWQGLQNLLVAVTALAHASGPFSSLYPSLHMQLAACS